MEDEIAAWDKLATNASEPNPFFEPWYLLPSLQHLPETDDVRVLRYECGGRLAGLLPVLRPRRYYRWPVPHIASWVHANCFCGVPLVERGAEAGFWRAVLEWADREPGIGLFLHLRAIPLDGPLHVALSSIAHSKGRRIELVHKESRAMLASPQSPENYWEAAMSGKKRKELRRQATRLSEQGAVTFERRVDADDVEPWCSRFLELEARGWKGKAGSALASSPATTRLFCESLVGAAGRGRLERLSLLLDGTPIAMLATFITPPGAYSYKTAFDERFARYSPGVLLQCENLGILQNADVAWSDSCASADHPMIDHIWKERRAIGRLSIGIGGSVRRAAFRRFVHAELARNPPGTSA